MKVAYLLDTHVVLWIDGEPKRFSKTARAQLAAAEELYYSAASAWESAIKRSSGKLQMNSSLSAIARGLNIAELAVTAAHGEAAAALPKYHKDPFDRLLVSQAMAEGLILVTSDATLQQYGVKLLIV
jgi:PIN domain nuclease of toxin-antitoxin system